MTRRLLSILLCASLFTLGFAPTATPAGAVEPGELPGEGNWSLGATNPFVLYDAQITPLRDGRIFIVNRGADGLEAEIYDPATDTFEVLADPTDLVAPGGHPSNVVPGKPVELSDGTILLAAVTLGAGWASHVQTYDPQSNAWTVLDGLPNVAVGFGPPAVALLSTGNVLVVGSAGNQTQHPGFVLNTVDGSTRSFEINGYFMNTGLAESGGTGNAFLFGYTGNLLGALLELRESDLSVRVVAEHLSLTDVRTGGLLVLPDGNVALVGSSNRNLTVINPATGGMTGGSLELPDGQSQPVNGVVLPDGSVMIPQYYRDRGHHIYQPGTAGARFVPQTGGPGAGIATTVGGATYAFAERRVHRFVLGRFVASAPGAVADLNVVRCCDAGAWMSWQRGGAGYDGGNPITGHVVTRHRGGQTETFDAGTNMTFHDPTGLVGDVYTVQAVNAVGPGEETSVTATRRNPPGGVRSLTATAEGKVVLTWEPPVDTGGSPIAEYVVIRTDQVDTEAGYPFGGSVVTTPRFVDKSVQVGAFYQYYVVARNEDGADWISAALAGATTDSDGLQIASALVGSPPPNEPPIAAEAFRTVRSAETSGVVLSAHDPDGDALTYEVTNEPEHGVLTGSAPNLQYTPHDGYTGPDALTFTVDDGNGGTATGVVTLEVTEPDSGAFSVSQPAAAGQTVATGAASSAEGQAQVAVTTPVAGNISISQDLDGMNPEGFALVGTNYRIEAPAASVDQPLALAFYVAVDQLPDGFGPDDVTVFRDGVPIEACTDETGWAVPDPCVAERSVEDGVITIRVLSSHASDWALGVRQLETSTTVAAIADSVYGQSMSLTAQVDQNGATAPTGTVGFLDVSTSPAQMIGNVPLDANGTALLTGITLDAGSHDIVASYSGSETSAASTSAEAPMRIAKAGLVVTTKSTSTLAGLLSLKMTYATTVVSAVTDDPVPGLSVTTKVDGASAASGCAATTDRNGLAVCSSGPIRLVLGGTFTATVAGTNNFRQGSASGKIPLF